MSIQEMEKMDEELMGLVNSHAAPDAVAAAEEIVERETAPKAVEHKELPGEWCVHENYCGPDQAVAVKKEGGRYTISEEKFKELEKEMEVVTRRRTLAAVVLCAVVFLVLLMVLAKPDLLIWLVNIGVVCCSVVAGIALDRWWRRK